MRNALHLRYCGPIRSLIGRIIWRKRDAGVLKPRPLMDSLALKTHSRTFIVRKPGPLPVKAPRIISRKEAVSLGLPLFYTGKPCKREHIAPRHVDNRACSVCKSERMAEYMKTYTRSSELKLNPEKARAKYTRYAKANPGKRNAIDAIRRAAKIKATPAWADRAAIRNIYVEAAERGLVVDHVVPLQGELVCGLHVHHNLQLLTSLENSIKGNRFDVE